MGETKHKPVIRVTRTNVEEVNLPPFITDSIKQSVDSWFNIYGAETISKCIGEYNDKNIAVLQEIQSTLKNIDEKLSTSLPLSQITIVKELTHDQAKEMIQSYLQEHKKADTDELLINLGIDLETLVKVLDELKNEGKIEGVD